MKKFLQNFKRFWSMEKHSTSGFTLVELIVVIAILAILAGVAIPAYSGYVEKANKQADQTLASDVAQALELGYYSNNMEGVNGYVVLSTDASPSVAAGTISSEEVATYLKEVFGENLNGMKLKYDGWTIKPGILSAALNSTGAAAVNKSSYITNSNVIDLLDNVQTVTSAAAGLLGSVAKSETQYLFALEAALGEDYLEKAAEVGILTRNGTDYSLNAETDVDGNVIITEDMQTQLANLMVFDVAEELKNADTTTMQTLMITGLADDATLPEGYSLASAMAARYAMFKAYALDSDDPAVSAAFDTMNASLSNASGKADAITALDTFFAENVEGLENYLMNDDGVTDAFNNNADAVSAIMNGVNSVKGDYTDGDSLKDSGLFTSSNVANDLNTFVNTSALSEVLTAEQTAYLSSLDNGIIILCGGANVSITPEQ